jgi:hypothetical protein
MLKKLKAWFNLGSTVLSVASIWLGPDVSVIFAHKPEQITFKDRFKLSLEDRERFRLAQLKDVMASMAMDQRETGIKIHDRPAAEVRMV